MLGRIYPDDKLEPPCFALRAAHWDDLPLLVNSWVRSYEWSPFAREAGPTYRERFASMVRRTLAKRAVTIACSREDPDTIVGWACTGPDVVFYVFVKYDVRKFGIAKALLAPYLAREGVRFACRPRRGVPLPQGWLYDPLALFLEDD